jgi:anti-anti-sigma factor
MYEFMKGTDHVLCTLSGRWDTGATAQHEAALLSGVRGAQLPLVFDLTRVEFVSSSFLRICVAAAKIRGQGGFWVVNPVPFVRNVFTIAGLDSFIHDTPKT